MPQAIPIAAAFVAKTLVAVGVPTAFAKTAAVFAVKAGIQLAVSAVANTLLAPDIDKAGSPTQWQADPNAGIPFAMGGTQQVGGRIVFRREFAPSVENMYLGVVTVLSGAGPVGGIGGLYVRGQLQTFNGSQQNTSGFGDKMYWSYQVGDQPQPVALSSPSILRSGVTIASAGWTSAHKLSGKAADMWTLGHDDVGNVYPGGSEPERLVEITSGIANYDLRNDDEQTAIGGSGAERWADRDTWGHPTNPVIGAHNWTLGLFENEVKVGGLGIGPDYVLADMFAACANVADLNGWTYAAYPTTVDDKWQVLKGLLQAGGAVPCTVDGRVGCWSRATIKTSLFTVTEDDLAGEVEVAPSNSRLDRINTVYASYRSAEAKWEVAPLAEPVTVAGLVEEDGEVRSREIAYPYVTDPDQAAQLALLDIMDSREEVTGVMACKPHMRHYRAGDALTLNLPVQGLHDQKIVILRRPDFDVASGVVRIAFRSETDSKYDIVFAGTGTPPDPVDPNGPPTIPTPDSDDWTAYGAIVGGKGVIQVRGEPSLPIASRMRVEYRLDGVATWTFSSEGAVAAGTPGRFVVGNLATTGTYYVALSYYNVAGSGPGPRLELGPISIDASGAGSGGLTAESFPDSASAFGTGTPKTTGSVTVTPSGGTGPYTYAWTLVSGDTFTIDSPTSATTTFSRNVGSGQSFAGIARCTVTDSAMNTFSVDVDVYFDGF